MAAPTLVHFARHLVKQADLFNTLKDGLDEAKAQAMWSGPSMLAHAPDAATAQALAQTNEVLSAPQPQRAETMKRLIGEAAKTQLVRSLMTTGTGGLVGAGIGTGVQALRRLFHRDEPDEDQPSLTRGALLGGLAGLAGTAGAQTVDFPRQTYNHSVMGKGLGPVPLGDYLTSLPGILSDRSPDALQALLQRANIRHWEPRLGPAPASLRNQAGLQ
jgi:hypothetical protein